MLWKRMTTIIGIVAAVLALPLSVAAGGWSTVELDAPPADVRPNQPFTIGFTVLQHGVRPVPKLAPTIMLTRSGSDERVVVMAREAGQPGHYVASITLPSAGTWHWEIAAFGTPVRMTPLIVAAPAPTAQPVPRFVTPWSALAAATMLLLGVGAALYAVRSWRRVGAIS
jgi:hypothetical protein